MLSKVISFVLVFLYSIINCHANHGMNYDKFNPYGNHFGSPQPSFGYFGSGLGSGYAPSFEPNYDPKFGFPNYGSNLAASFRTNYFSRYVPNMEPIYGQPSQKISNKRKSRRYGETKRIKSCDHLLHGSQQKESYPSFQQSEEYSNPASDYAYSPSQTNPQTSGQQMDSSLLPIIALLSKQMSSNTPVIQNFVNPTLGSSNPSLSLNNLTDFHRVGESVNSYNYKSKPKTDKRKLKVKKIVFEDLHMDKKA